MLGKLIKYELKSASRYLLPLYAGLLLLALINRLSAAWLSTGNSDQIYGGLLLFFYVMLVIGVFVITAVSIILRFYHNLLGREGYLMFTLPVTTSANIFSKLLAAMLWCVASMIIFFFSLLILTATTPQIFDLGAILTAFRHAVGGEMLNALLFFGEFCLFCLLGLASCILLCYLSMAIGQLANRNKLLLSVVAFFGLQFICNTGLVLVMACGSFGQLAGSAPVQWFLSLSEYAAVHTVLLSLCLSALLVCALFYTCCYWLLHKKLNLA